MALPRLAVSAPSVLVVDDYDAFRDACTRTLEGAGFTVQSASTEQEAMQKVLHGNFDLALIDIMLSEQDRRGGLKVISELRRVNPRTKIIAISGSHDINVALESFRLGVFEFLPKGSIDLSGKIVVAAERAAQANDPNRPPNEVTSSPMRERFERLASAWRAETQFSSSAPDIFMNKNYQEIIGQGVAIVPFILEDLKKGPDHWYWALGAITGDNSAENAPPGDIAAISAAWLEWGRRKGIVR